MKDLAKLATYLRKQGVKVSGLARDGDGALHVILEEENEVEKLMQFSSFLPKQFKVEKGKFKFLSYRLESTQPDGYHIEGVGPNGARWLCSADSNGVTNYHCVKGAVALHLMNGDQRLYQMNVVNMYPYTYINYFDASIVDHALWWRYPRNGFDTDLKAVLFAGNDKYAVLFDAKSPKYKFNCVREISNRVSVASIGDVIYGRPWDKNANADIERSLKVVARGVVFVSGDATVWLFRDVLYAQTNDSTSYPSIPGYSGSAWFSERVPEPNPA